MFRDGTYTAWFRTARGQGTATVHLAEGRISGGDSFFAYRGAYEVTGDCFTATLTTSRIAEGPTTVLGVDEVELKLRGVIKGTIACCIGTAAQAPDVTFEATLFLGPGGADDQVELPPPPRSGSKITKLPKPNGDRYRARPPFPSGPSRQS